MKLKTVRFRISADDLRIITLAAQVNDDTFSAFVRRAAIKAARALLPNDVKK